MKRVSTKTSSRLLFATLLTAMLSLFFTVCMQRAGAATSMTPASADPSTIGAMALDPMFYQVKAMTGSDATPISDKFAEALAISGNTLVVGARASRAGGVSYSGAVHIFERNEGAPNGWGEAKIMLSEPPDPDAFTPEDQFGSTVALDADRLVIGAPQRCNGQQRYLGAVYIYERNQGGANQWGQVKKLQAPDVLSSSGFGLQVSLSGDRIAVSEGREIVYIFEKDRGGANNWGLIQTIVAPNYADNEFGFSLAIDKDLLVVGALAEDNLTGAAYIFARNQGGTDNWGQVKRLVPPGAPTYATFGGAVSISGDTVAIGADGESRKGAVYIFQRNNGGTNNWGLTKRLTASDAANTGNDSFFGINLALNGDRLAVGATGDRSKRGAVYVLERNEGGNDNWGELQKLTDPTGPTNKQFGYSIDLDGEFIAVGALTIHKAYVFVKDSVPGITASPSVSRAKGGAGSTAGIATASDSPNSAEDLIISVESAPEGILINNFSNTNGAITAYIEATCAATTGDQTVVLKVSDSVGLTATANFTVTVTPETTPPVINCSGNKTVSTDQGQCSASVAFTVSAQDNCDGALIPTCKMGNTVITSPYTFPKGVTSVTCSATDANSNSNMCSFTVTVADTQAPAIHCPANLVVANAVNTCSSAPVAFTASATDNCDGNLTPNCTPASGSTFPKGTTTVNCSVTDSSSNSANCSFTITVNDTQTPQITGPANITVPAATGSCSAVVSFAAPVVSDNCPGVGSPTCSPASGSTFPKGTTTINCSVRDAANLQANCSFIVTVNDTQQPTITCPANQTRITARPGDVSVPVTYSAPVASDNCGAVSVACNPPSGAAFPLGTTTVTCTATDAAGNKGSCSFTVTVFDVCLQDDSNPSAVLLWNSVTGSYRYCCNGTTYSGSGSVTRKGNLFTLSHNSDRRISASVDTGYNRGTATFQAPLGVNLCAITDRDIRNNSCQCQ